MIATRRGGRGLTDLDQGSTQGFPVQGYAVTAAWANGRPVRGTGLGRQRG